MPPKKRKVEQPSSRKEATRTRSKARREKVASMGVVVALTDPEETNLDNIDWDFMSSSPAVTESFIPGQEPDKVAKMPAVKRSWNEHVVQDHPELIAEKVLSSESTIANALQLRKLDYNIKCFPRIKYLHKMIRLSQKRFQIGHWEQFRDILSEYPVVSLYLPSNTTEEKERLISKSHGQTFPKDTKAVYWPDSVLLYFQVGMESIDDIKQKIQKMESGPWKHVVIVIDEKDKHVFHNSTNERYSITTVKENKKAIRDVLTKSLEGPIHRYLEYMWSELSKERAERIHCLKAEIRSLQTLLSSHMKEPPDKIPERIKEYLFGKKAVQSFGLWEGNVLRINVKPEFQKESLEEELLSLAPQYMQSHKLEILECEIKLTHFAKQGDKLYPEIFDKSDHSSCSASSTLDGVSVKESCYGTLGGFMREKRDQQKLFGLSCRHVLKQKNNKIYVKFGTDENLSELGQTIYIADSENRFHDFAVFEVNADLCDKCEKHFVNDDDEESNASVHVDDVEPDTIVHKKGAKTAWTTGRIQSHEFYSDLFGDRNDVFLVANSGETDYFSEEGDSGSIVFTRDRSPDQSSVSVLGMVFGGVDSIYDSRRPDIEKSTACFRFNAALDTLRKKETLALEFVPKDSGSSSDSDEKEDE